MIVILEFLLLVLLLMVLSIFVWRWITKSPTVKDITKDVDSKD